jgi:hypothetical protein
MFIVNRFVVALAVLGTARHDRGGAFDLYWAVAAGFRD